MNKPQLYKFHGCAKITIEIIAADIESACDKFYAAQDSDFEIHEREIGEVEDLGEYYAD